MTDETGDESGRHPTEAHGYEWEWGCPECGIGCDESLKDGETVTCYNCRTEFRVHLQLETITTPKSTGRDSE